MEIDFFSPKDLNSLTCQTKQRSSRDHMWLFALVEMTSDLSMFVCTCNNYENLQIGKVDPWEISSRFASFVVYVPTHFEQHTHFFI